MNINEVMDCFLPEGRINDDEIIKTPATTGYASGDR